MEDNEELSCPDLRESLAMLLNTHCMENGSNTPDFLLSEYLLSCLEAFDTATLKRERWYGTTFSPGEVGYLPNDVDTGQ